MPMDFAQAMARAVEWGPKTIPLGLFYVNKGKPTHEKMDPALAKFGAPAKQRLGLGQEERQQLVKAFL